MCPTTASERCGMLNWLTSLFFSFHGRIPRKSYWLAQAILLIPGITTAH